MTLTEHLAIEIFINSYNSKQKYTRIRKHRTIPDAEWKCG